MSKLKKGKIRPILVTGGCGYIGSRLSILLDKKGYKVAVVDKVAPKKRGIVFSDSIEFRQADLRDKARTRQAVKGAGTIVHLAANVGSLTYMHNHQAEIIQENCAIDANIYPVAAEEGVERIIYSSSSMVFQHSQRFPYREIDLFKIPPPTNVYGMSKLVGEYFCRAYREQFGLPYVILRYHNVYGPGEDSKGEGPGDIHVIPALIEKVVNGQYPIEILGDINDTRTFTYIDDVVEATSIFVERALVNDKQVLNNDFNIGLRDSIKIIDLAKLIWEILGDGRPFRYTIKKTKAITAKRREMDPLKIEKILGWQPKVSLEEGIIKTSEWIKNRKKRSFSILN